MFDYKLLEALATVVSESGFDKAAKVLHLTQSAISQRIRLLEEQTGQILLVRTSPPTPTSAGQQLLKHALQVRQLEEDLRQELGSGDKSGWINLALGINADSLATWFPQIILPFLRDSRILLDIRVDDQEQTHRLLKDGEVIGCVSTQEQAMQGCSVTYLGCMHYRAWATPSFAQIWLPQGFDREASERAPIILFNRKDEVHHRLLEQLWGLVPTALPAHHAPSSEQFARWITAGIGYGMLPDQQSASAQKQGLLIDLAPGHSVPVKLYWHCWNIQSPSLLRLTAHLAREARRLLDDSPATL